MVGDFPRGARFSKKLKRTWAFSHSAGKSQVLKYLAGTNAGSRVNMNALIAHVDEHGYHQSQTKYRPIDGPLVELKVHSPKAIRVLAYRLPQGGHVLLVGFDKADGPIPADVKKRAMDLATEFENGGMQLD